MKLLYREVNIRKKNKWPWLCWWLFKIIQWHNLWKKWIDKLDFIKLKIFSSVKDTIKKMRIWLYVLGWGANGVKLPSVGLWLNASKSESCPSERQGSTEEPWLASDSQTPLSHQQPTAFRDQDPVQRACRPPGMQAQLERGHPLASHATHVSGEPGAKPFTDNLLLGQGFIRSRAAPLLLSTESQP